MRHLNLPICPQAGGGVNRWLLSAALILRNAEKNDTEIAEALKTGSAGCGRHVKPEEIHRAVKRSGELQRASAYQILPTKPKWPEIDQHHLATVLELGLTVRDLQSSSPVFIPSEANMSEEVIQTCFKPETLLCCGWSSRHFKTQKLESWIGQFKDLQFIVPSPMSKVAGLTLEGKTSYRCLNNSGKRRFLVIECDRGTLDEQACILWRLAKIAPLILVVHSGGKSLHGWFWCEGVSESRLLSFMRYAVSLGADPATWTRCQFVRMPDGMRENGKRQKLLYYAPDVLEMMP